MYATCQQLRAQAQAHAAAASGLLSRAEFRFHMPPSIAFATRGRLHGLRLQLALLDREFDDLGVVLFLRLCFLQVLGKELAFKIPGKLLSWNLKYLSVVLFG